MGASCASGKKSSKRMKNNSTPGTNTSQVSTNQCNNFEQAVKENIGFKDCLESNHKVTKTSSNYLSVNESKSTQSNVSSLTSTSVITKPNLKSNLSTQSSKNSLTKLSNNSSPQSSKSAQPKSEQNAPPKKNRVNQLEHFILERKRYMQERGVAVYTAYTILPPPILKSVKLSTIQKKRNLPCVKETSLKTIQENHKRSSPATMLNGDLDPIVVEF